MRGLRPPVEVPVLAPAREAEARPANALDLVARYPLPAGVSDPGVPLNRSQLARAFQVSENTITKWIDKGMPVLEAGTNGQAYKFVLAECYAWRRHDEETERAEREASDRAAQQLSMLFRNDDEEDRPSGRILTADEIARESEADFKRNKAAELRGDLVRASRVRALNEEVLAQARIQIITLVDFCEMEFGLSADQVDVLQRRVNATLVDMRDGLARICATDARPRAVDVTEIGGAGG